MIRPALEVSGLTVHAGRRCLLALEQVRAESGRITALMGPNGAGKSTLLRACLGLTRPSGGRIAVLGEEVARLRQAALAALRRRMGYVPQLLPGHSELPLTLREVVAIGRTARAGLLRPLSRRDWQLVDEWIDRLGLGDLANRSFRQLSGGEQRKTIIARAMAQEPELLLLDEPTANLDLGWRERMVETVASALRADAGQCSTRVPRTRGAAAGLPPGDPAASRPRVGGRFTRNSVYHRARPTTLWREPRGGASGRTPRRDTGRRSR